MFKKYVQKIAPRVEVPTLYVWQCTTWEFNVFPVDGFSPSEASGLEVFIKDQLGEGDLADEQHCGKVAGDAGVTSSTA